MVSAYRRHYVVDGAMFDTTRYDGVLEVLTELAGRGYRLAVATSKPEPHAGEIVAHLGLAEFFVTVCGDTVDGARDSKALVVGEALRRLGEPDPSRVLMVGDRSHDVLGAAAHGLDCAGALWGYGTRDRAAGGRRGVAVRQARRGAGTATRDRLTMLGRWRFRAAGDARFLTLASLRWVLRNRAYTPWYLVRYWRFWRFKLANPHVLTTGFVFLGKNVELYARPGFGRLVLGRWVHLGDGTSLRCHEGSLRIGDKVVFGRNNVVNAYLDVSIGAASIIADMVYVTDFDHVFADLDRPIKDQGIAKSPVRIGADVWLANKVSVVRGTVIGDGCVVAANAVVTRDLPPYSVAVGVPARVIRNRRSDHAEAADTRAAIADMAAKLGLS